MPGSLTTPGRQGARAVAPEYVAFHHMHGVGTQNRKLSRLNGWSMRTPVNASPRPSRATAHDSGPMWIATPSSQGTYTLTPCQSPGASACRFRSCADDGHVVPVTSAQDGRQNVALAHNILKRSAYRRCMTTRLKQSSDRTYAHPSSLLLGSLDFFDASHSLNFDQSAHIRLPVRRQAKRGTTRPRRG
jgi:hypothetical protein